MKKKSINNIYPGFITINIKRRFWLFYEKKFAIEAYNLLLILEKSLGFKIISFVIMPDHIHLFVYLNESCVPNIIQRFKSLFYYELRRKFKLKDVYWQKSCFSLYKNTFDEQLKTIFYIKNNPKKAKLPARFSRCPYYYENKKLLKRIQTKSGRLSPASSKTSPASSKTSPASSKTSPASSKTSPVSSKTSPVTPEQFLASPSLSPVTFLNKFL